jgi:UDP-N-acetylglucosamine 2-epimerase (non-hydrolysing)
MKLLALIGTRPEAIKLAPLVLNAKHSDFVTIDILTTGQHEHLVKPVLDFFDLEAKYELEIKRSTGKLNELLSQLLSNFCHNDLLVDYEGLIVQGDTTSALAGGIAAFHQRKAVFHVEAGLRTGNFDDPFPEEMNRLLLSRLATFNFCPTEQARDNLLREGISKDRIDITGNTVVDNCVSFNTSFPTLKLSTDIHNYVMNQCRDNKQYILITCHRRENQGPALTHLCKQLLVYARSNPHKNIAFVMHANKELQAKIKFLLSNIPNIMLFEPLSYQDFTYLLMNCSLIITDSGGIQEEAPSFEVPVMIYRKTTERQEALQFGNAILVDTGSKHLLDALKKFDKEQITFEFGANPFGDGYASKKIIKRLIHLYNK